MYYSSLPVYYSPLMVNYSPLPVYSSSVSINYTPFPVIIRYFQSIVRRPRLINRYLVIGHRSLFFTFCHFSLLPVIIYYFQTTICHFWSIIHHFRLLFATSNILFTTPVLLIDHFSPLPVIFPYFRSLFATSNLQFAIFGKLFATFCYCSLLPI